MQGVPTPGVLHKVLYSKGLHNVAVRKCMKIKDRITTRASRLGAPPHTSTSNVWLFGKFTYLF